MRIVISHIPCALSSDNPTLGWRQAGSPSGTMLASVFPSPYVDILRSFKSDWSQAELGGGRG